MQQLAGPQGCHGSAGIARAASAQPAPLPPPCPVPAAAGKFSSISPGTRGAAAAGGAFPPPVPPHLPGSPSPTLTPHSPKLGAQSKAWDPGVTSSTEQGRPPPKKLSLGRFVVFFSSLQWEQCQSPAPLGDAVRAGLLLLPHPFPELGTLGCRGTPWSCFLSRSTRRLLAWSSSCPPSSCLRIQVLVHQCPQNVSFCGNQPAEKP